MAPSPSPRNGTATPTRTPSSRSRLHFPSRPSISPLPGTVTEHPVEVVGRIRDLPGMKERQQGAIEVVGNGYAVRVRTDSGYRDFSLDGVSNAESDGLDAFYKKFVEARVHAVKAGGKCTVMMYGPTGSGKSHTMFGCPKEPGIVYRALHNILGDENGEGGGALQQCRFSVNVSVVEIYNEEIYDLLASNTASFRPSGCRARLEVMGRKVKNAIFISGSNAGKIASEVAKVEKRRVVKSTFCNERSSRSHCLITLDVPAVGGRLMLVDMAGSENIDQAGNVGFEAKLQTAKINQGNIALKRVVEAIANGDSHVPFRDSKLTMLLQDSFEDDGTKILMVLCASPDPRDIHRTIGTLEYGAKAKCIVRCSTSPTKEKTSSQDINATVLGARIVAMDEYISKLQMENKLKEEEREAAQRELLKKEEEVAKLRAKLEEMKEKQSEKEEEIELKVEEKARLLKIELLRKFEECQKSANMFVELGKRKMEEKILRQKEEVEMLRQRLEEIESELNHMKSTTSNDLIRMDASMEIENISNNCEAQELVASSARVLEGMEAYIQQTREKFLSPQDNVQKFPHCMVEDGNYLNGHAEVISSDGNRLFSSGFVGQLNSDNSKDSSGKSMFGSEENAPMVEESAPLSGRVNNSFYLPNNDERGLIYQRFPFLQSNSNDNYGRGHDGDDVEEEEDHAEATMTMKRGWLPTVYEEEEEDIRDGDRPQGHSSEKEATSNSRDLVISHSAKTQIVHGFSAEGSFGDHFEPKLQQKSCVEDCSKFAPDKQAERGGSDNSAFRLAKPVVTDADTNLNGGNTQTRLLGSTEQHNDPTISRKTRIQNIFLLCGNYRELAKQVRNTSSNKDNQINGETSDPVDNMHVKTPKGAEVGSLMTTLPRSSSWNSTTPFKDPIDSLSSEVAGLVSPTLKSMSPYNAKVTGSIPTLRRSSSWNNTTSFEEPIDNLSPEVAGLVTPSRKSTSPQDAKVTPWSRTSPQDAKVTPWSRTPEGTANKELRSPRLFTPGEVENGVPISKCLSLNDRIRAALTEVTSFQQVDSGLSHKDDHSFQQRTERKEDDENQEAKDEKCDVYVKWEKSKEATGKLIRVLKMSTSANLSDLRKMIEPHIADKKQDFVFLMLGDPSGAPVSREKEASVKVTSLPDCQNQRSSRLACLRLPSKRLIYSHSNHQEVPFNSLENKFPSISPPPSSTTSNIDASNCNGPLLSAAQKLMSKMGNQTVASGGKNGHKVGSGSLLKGLRL